MLMPHPHAAPPQHRSARTPGTWAEDHDLPLWSKSTNAPDGAGRSLTPHHVHAVRARARRLNAPDGAGCSLTGGRGDADLRAHPVSMHLMVLGAP